ncbi:CaiB/BaiF CoA transferase family protein [Rhizohabitans arisaemae]|uniref:CaiB/BaiF CoA transferase family protein n=1 Tax=Rhizohabitans arisaemae TaxID=2720610 RepID=UPI0024B0DEDF|nr:CoA transferase [Rhizohabitans arisaemae]
MSIDPPPRTGPLRDLTVIDLTQMLAGPYCTMMLADLGADVIKVEPPGGDLTRWMGPRRDGDGPEALGGYFQSVNRNKRGIVLDLKTEAGKESLFRLVAGADVLVENFSAGVMDRLGLSYETLSAINPVLVYGCVRGFGDPRSGGSPYQDWPAFDVTAQAMGGLVGITGAGPGQPVKTGPGIGDIFPGALCAIGILAAVHEARRSNLGQFVDVAMYDSVLSLCERIVYQYSYTGRSPLPQGNTHPLLCPFDVYPTADGFLALAAPGDRHWRVLCDLMGRPELGDDPRYRTNADRVGHAPVVRAIVADWLAVRTTAEALSVLGGHVPCGPVNDARAVFADPHVRRRDMLCAVEQPGSAEPVVIAGQPIKFSLTPSGVRHRAPRLDEHRDDILARFCGDPTPSGENQ